MTRSFEQIDRQYQVNWSAWEVGRLMADDANLPKGWYRRAVMSAVESRAKSIRRIERRFRFGRFG